MTISSPGPSAIPKSHAVSHRPFSSVPLSVPQTPTPITLSRPNSISRELFSYISQRLKDTATGFKLETFKKGEFIFQRGQRPRGVYFIKYGWVKLSSYDEDYNEVVLRILGNNEFLGHTAVIKETEHRHDAQALEYSELYLIHRNHFLRLMYEDHYFTRLMIQLLCDEVYADEQQITNLHSKRIDRRLASLLIALERYSHQDDRYEDNHIRILKKDLARNINVTPETLSRYLAKFEESGIIRNHGGAIELLDKDLLNAMSDLKD